MAGGKVLGPKCSKCCFGTSIWGIIMFLLMGAAFYLKSPALYEDTPINKKLPEFYSNKTLVFESYEATAINCFIAAGLYVLVLFFSLWQMKVNDRLQSYTVQ